MSARPPILVTGASGQLGTAFRRRLGSSALFIDRSELDLSVHGNATAMLAARRPGMVINCAAYTAVDLAEDEESIAFAVNASSVGEMARACRDIGARFITYSTDYVFDGSKTHAYVESDATAPINAYGRSKLAGEQAALSENPDSLVIRTSWVMSGTHRNFASIMLSLVERGPVSVVDDQIGRPTMANDLVLGTLAAADAGATGVLHMTNDGVTSWFGLAKLIASIAGLDDSRVSACSTADYPTKAKRPQNSVLESDRMASLGIAELPNYQPGLEQAIREMQRAERT